jgi:aspartate/methionine/tyrosine aminotransferase
VSCDELAPSISCMGMVDRALALEREGVDVIHLEKGETDLDTPDAVTEAAVRALRDGRTRYTTSAGLPELRQAVCDYYLRAWGARIRPSQVFVNSGSSPALLTLLLAVLEPGGEVLLPDPGYPAYPGLVRAAGGRPVPVSTVADGFVQRPDAVGEAITPLTRAIVINSPANPTGAVLDEAALADFARLGPLVISDDVYLELAFDRSRQRSILAHTDAAAAVGSFSKAFNMTGWRLGYVVVPDHLVARVQDLQENLFVCANSFVQWAGVAALAEAETHASTVRAELRTRQDTLLRGLAELGLEVPCPPRGGFYAFARLPERLLPSARFARDLLERAHVAVTPGGEFGPSGEGYVRFSCAAPSARIEEAIRRIRAFAEVGGVMEVQR